MSERTIDVTGLPGAKKPSCAAALVGESARVAYEESRRRAEEAGRPLYDEILSNHRRYLEQEKQKLAQAISSRRRGYKLRWPDGKELAHATFVPSQAPRRARLRPAGLERTLREPVTCRLATEA